MLRPVACVNECGGVAEGLVHLYKGAREGLVPLIDTIDNRYGLGASSLYTSTLLPVYGPVIDTTLGAAAP